MPNYDNVDILVRVLIIIIFPLIILLATYLLASSATLSSTTNILNIELDIALFIYAVGAGFAILSFFALLYAFLVRRNIHG